MTAASRFLVIILVVLGVLAIAAGIIYYVEPAKSLPATRAPYRCGSSWTSTPRFRCSTNNWRLYT